MAEVQSSNSFDGDLILVRRFIEGDADAFRLIYEQYYGRVYAIAQGILLDREEAKDVVQEIFTLAYKNLRRFDWRSNFSTWLFRIAVNRSIQQTRYRKRRIRPITLQEAAEVPTAFDSNYEMTPEVYSALEKLKPLDRSLILLYYWEDLNLEELAKATDCSVNTAKTRLFRARERFKKMYEEQTR